VCQGDVRNSPIETIELKTPVRVDRRALRPGSGGAGKYRGGLGMITQMTNLSEGRWSLSNSGRRKLPPWGLWGGLHGAASVNRVRRAGETAFRDEDPVRALLPAGTSVIVETAGGGGWGDPLDRDPLLVRRDVLEEFVSRAAAAADYGVVLDGDDALDERATDELRAARRKGRTTHG
jgi:N-methylhydantoinase B